MINIKEWAKAAGIRALKTIYQTAVASIGVSSTMGDVNWGIVGSTALLAGIISILTSVAGLPEISNNTEITIKEKLEESKEKED